jgi:hypothetical protein
MDSPNTSDNKGRNTRPMMSRSKKRVKKEEGNGTIEGERRV